MTVERSKGVGRYRVFFAKYNVSLIAAVLLSVAGIFFLRATQIRSTTKFSNPDAFTSGDLVTVVEIIDGDDVLIERDNGVKTRLRIMGIDTFSSTVSDPLLSEYGRICMQHLKARAKGKVARLSIPEKRLGHKGRLLGTLHLQDESGDYTRDLGLDLVRKGYALVYTRYPFDKMSDYLVVEAEARSEHAGFWSDPVVSSRAAALKMLWEEERATHD